MKQIAQKLVERKYSKRIVAILLAAGILLAAAAILIPVTLHKQIAEFRALEETREEEKQSDAPAALPVGQGEHKKDDREHELKAMLRQLTPIGKGTRIAFAVLAVLAFLLFAFYWITVTEWLYKMAVLHGLNRALWPMLGLLFNVLVLPVLLVVLCDPRRVGKQVQS